MTEQDNTAIELRKKLKSDFKSKALTVFKQNGERVAYGWTPESFIELVDEYSKQHTEAAVLEARINELESMAILAVDNEELLPMLSDRIATLTNQIVKEKTK